MHIHWLYMFKFGTTDNQTHQQLTKYTTQET